MVAKKISVVIPIYNEAESIKELYQELVMMLPTESEIIFVDDGSRDRTREVAAHLTRAHLISFARNFGKSQALQAGFDHASGDIIITMDGDLQDDPHEIPRFIEKISEGWDLVCGWKYDRKDPLSKRVVSKIANGAARLLTDAKVHDMNCCFKAYRREVAQSLVLHGDLHRYIPALVAGQGFRVTEIKINHRERKYGKSKYGIARLFNSTFDFLTILFFRKFADRPLHFFGLIGAIAGALGTITLGYLGWIKIFSGALIGNRPLLLLGALLFMVGIQLISLGFLGDLIVRQELSNKRRYIIRKDSLNS